MYVIKHLGKNKITWRCMKVSFSKLVGYNHPSIWTLIKKMRLELFSDETKLAQFAIGNFNHTKPIFYQATPDYV